MPVSKKGGLLMTSSSNECVLYGLVKGELRDDGRPLVPGRLTERAETCEWDGDSHPGISLQKSESRGHLK